MLLAIDCGNTNTVFGLRRADGGFTSWRMGTSTSMMVDDYEAWIHYHLSISGYDFNAITGVIISSVVPETLPAIKSLAERIEHSSVYILNADDDRHGVPIKIDHPHQAGSDRIANAAAVMAHYTAPAVVIDFGTATTLDLVDKDGAYCGGVISPGVNLSIDGLYKAAARLPMIDPARWHGGMPVIGASTIEAMNSGLFYGYISLVEGLLARVLAAWKKERVSLIATGGLGRIFCDAITVIDCYDSDLTLKGLAAIYDRHQE